MTKRILILSIALTFLVSTTGLPITLHLCEMMQQESISECEMCAPVIEEPTCCSEETDEPDEQLTSSTPVCCQTEFNFNKIEDSFLSAEKSRILNFDISASPIFTPTEILTEFYSGNSLFYGDLSPPTITPDLFILNSALLI